MDGAHTLPDTRVRLGGVETLPDAVDLSHHLSKLSRERINSPLKVSVSSLGADWCAYEWL